MFDLFYIYIVVIYIYIYIYIYRCLGQLVRNSTNPIDPELNDYVSLQWP
jgi:hypothetical protein